MLKQVTIDKSIYLVDNEDKSFRLLRRNPAWKLLTEKENTENKKRLNGYTKILSNDKTKKYMYNNKSKRLTTVRHKLLSL